jgi:hypothetical protein
LSDSGPTCSPKCPSDEREQKGKDAREREDSAYPLLGYILRNLTSRTRQCDAAKLVNEICANRCSYEPQYDRYH